MSFLGCFTRYRSALTGAACVAVATDRSANRKTGDVVQVSFLAAHEEPHRAVRSGADRAVCGDCPQRPTNGGACYVVTCQGPLSQHRAWRRGRYRDGAAPVGKPVRYGTYGDPASMPRRAFLALHRALSPQHWTGYTHAWRDRPDLAPFLMASVDSEEEAGEARGKGWRYFRVKRPGEPLLPGEIQCPAERSAGRVQCRECLLCCGTSRKGPSVAIDVHGARAGNFK